MCVPSNLFHPLGISFGSLCSPVDKLLPVSHCASISASNLKILYPTLTLFSGSAELLEAIYLPWLHRAQFPFKSLRSHLICYIQDSTFTVPVGKKQIHILQPSLLLTLQCLLNVSLVPKNRDFFTFTKFCRLSPLLFRISSPH